MLDPKARVISCVKRPFRFDYAPRGILQVVRGAAYSQKPGTVPSVLQIMIRKHLLRREETGNRPHYVARQIRFILVEFQYILAVRGDDVPGAKPAFNNFCDVDSAPAGFLKTATR